VGSEMCIRDSLYGASKHPKTVKLDPHRDATDEAILVHALSVSKPVDVTCPQANTPHHSSRAEKESCME